MSIKPKPGGEPGRADGAESSRKQGQRSARKRQLDHPETADHPAVLWPAAKADRAHRARLLEIQQERLKRILDQERGDELEPTEPREASATRQREYKRAGGANRRRAQRVAINEQAQFQVDKIRRTGLVRDISRWGLLVQCSVPVPRYSLIKVFLPLHFGYGRNELCYLPGVVIWSDDRVLGVEFKEIPAESLNLLRTFLQLNGR